jgi:tRNA threonylcarbamoyladenosine biosynthesis protein TsaB
VIILAVETALGACSAAVISDRRVLAQEHEPMLRGHAEALAPMVQRVMKHAGMEFRCLQRVAVTTGPGTFTGQRVGLAFARSLALALRIPAVGISTLETMAAEALSKFPDALWAISTADAKRSEIYLAARAQDSELLIPPQLISVEQAASVVSATAQNRGFAPVLAGSAAQAVHELLIRAGYSPVESSVRQPTADFVALACERLPEIDSARPLYLRPPDAKLPTSR